MHGMPRRKDTPSGRVSFRRGLFSEPGRRTRKKWGSPGTRLPVPRRAAPHRGGLLAAGRIPSILQGKPHRLGGDASRRIPCRPATSPPCRVKPQGRRSSGTPRVWATDPAPARRKRRMGSGPDGPRREHGALGRRRRMGSSPVQGPARPAPARRRRRAQDHQRHGGQHPAPRPQGAAQTRRKSFPSVVPDHPALPVNSAPPQSAHRPPRARPPCGRLGLSSRRASRMAAYTGSCGTEGPQDPSPNGFRRAAQSIESDLALDIIGPSL